jgi:hypothetical protein
VGNLTRSPDSAIITNNSASVKTKMSKKQSNCQRSLGSATANTDVAKICPYDFITEDGSVSDLYSHLLST